MLVHKQKINAFKICDLITDPKSLDSSLLPHHHNNDIGFIVYLYIKENMLIHYVK